jgi:uncharacterized membrane protein YkoI
MKRIFTLPMALLTSALVGASLAQAATPSGATAGSSPVAASSPTRFVPLQSRVRPDDLSAFSSSQISLQDAVTAAATDSGGIPVDAIFRAGESHPHYLVWLTKDGRVYHSIVDAQSGRVTEAMHGLPLHRLNPSERANVMAVAHAKAGLADAIAIAARDTGDKPIAGYLAESEGMRAYHIAIVENGALKSIWISPDNPSIVASK